MSRPWRVPRTKEEWRTMARVFAVGRRDDPCLAPMGAAAPCLPCQSRAILAAYHAECRKLGLTIPESIEVRLPSPCLEEPGQQ